MQNICKIGGCSSLAGNVTDLDAISCQFKEYVTSGYSLYIYFPEKNMQKICTICNIYEHVCNKNTICMQSMQSICKKYLCDAKVVSRANLEM